MSEYKRSKFIVGITVKNYENFIAIYNTLTRAFVIVLKKNWLQLCDNDFEDLDSDMLQKLCTQGFVVKNDIDEIFLFESWKQQIVHDYIAIRSKNLVTRKCNNKCRYCIIEPEAKEMSSETALDIDMFYINFIKNKKPKMVRDDYLGGEPLLKHPVILESAGRRFYFCKGRDIDYGFTITTNGTLINESVISKMKDVGLTAVRVSLAGPCDVHDYLRPSKDNLGYEKILENLQKISQLIPINIEYQYDSSSNDYIRFPEMMDDLAKKSIRCMGIGCTPILPRRKNSDFSSGTGDPAISLFLKNEALRYKIPMDDAPPSNACMADLRPVFVFDTDGSVLPCPSLQSNEMAYGNVTTGIDFVSESQLLNRSLPEKCLSQCELLPLCMGGCRLQALTNYGDFNGIDCQYDAYRMLLDDYVEKKAIEVLSQQGKDKFMENAD